MLITFKIRAEEKALLQARALSAGLTVSQFIRRSIGLTVRSRKGPQPAQQQQTTVKATVCPQCVRTGSTWNCRACYALRNPD